MMDDDWGKMPMKRRAELIMAYQSALLAHKEELVTLDMLETGKVNLMR